MQNILISSQKPKIYERLKKKFGVSWEGGIIICFYPYIHCIFKVSPAKVVHEATHLRQQKVMGVNEWWDKYISDEKFRLIQELEAYREEANFVTAKVKDRNLRFRMIADMARELSGPIYGSIIGFTDALHKIKK